MKPIDFDYYFREYIERWIAENEGNAKNYDELESRLPEAQLKFLNTPAPWLNGEEPGIFFQKMSDPVKLVQLIVDYENEGVSIPDMLLERVVELSENAVPSLIACASNESMPEPVRIIMLNLLIELEADEPMPLCLRLIRERAGEDALADVAAELLRNIGYKAVNSLLGELEGASDDALLTFLDILCNFPGEESIYTYAARQFVNRPDQRMYYASYLSKLGDERALTLLYDALREPGLNYLDYIEMRNAIEALGGELGEEREFSGDQYYESLKRMER